MKENWLGENIMRCRKERGLSQEKVAEYMGVSRQAVTKWENGVSKPSSENLIKLAKLLEMEVEGLLSRGEEAEREKTEAGKAPWIFVGISAVCILGYLVVSSLRNNFSIGVLICMFVLCVPIQLFVHIYFSNALRNNSFSGIAGFDDRLEYNLDEVKKMLVQIDLRIGVLSAVSTFLLCVINCVDWELGWLNGVLLAVYILDLLMTIEALNYKMCDKIYRKEEDKRRAKQGMRRTIVGTLISFVGIGILGLFFGIN